MKPDAIDPVIHAPARLQIMAVLSCVQDAEFALMRDLVQVSDSGLSKHLAQLSEHGYVKLRKASQNGHSRGWAAITPEGRQAFKSHVQALHALVSIAEAMGPIAPSRVADNSLRRTGDDG